MAATFIVFLIINLVPGGPFECGYANKSWQKWAAAAKAVAVVIHLKGSGSESLSVMDYRNEYSVRWNPFCCVT